MNKQNAIFIMTAVFNIKVTGEKNALYIPSLRYFLKHSIQLSSLSLKIIFLLFTTYPLRNLLTMFQQTLSFNGRIRRIEYGLSYPMCFVVLGCVSLIPASVESTLLFSVKAILVISLFWAVLAQGARRCHDRGNSGWWQLIPFYTLWMLFADSKTGENDYGPNSKGIGNGDWVAEMGNEIQKQSFIS